MADNLMSADRTADLIYKHDGFSTTILDSIATPGSDIRSITWDGDLYSIDPITDLIYKHDGFSTNILDSIATPLNNGYGLTVDVDGNIYSVDAAVNLMYKHDGFSTTILDSTSPPGSGSSYDITTDGTDFYVFRGSTIYKVEGFSNTVLDSFSDHWANAGLTWDGTDLYDSNYSRDDISHRDGFSSTKLETIASPSTDPTGLTWENFDARIGAGAVFIPKIMIV
jgi:hypothetical protein